MELKRIKDVAVYRLLQPPVKLLMGLFGCRTQRARGARPPYIVICNHNLDWDGAPLSGGFPRQMYFVAGEHSLRMGLWSRLLSFFFAPVAKQKGASDAGAVRDILRHIKKGHNICLFAEGNRSWDGRSAALTDATGKLLRLSGASVITYRLTGTYFIKPRWASSLRRGPVRGEWVKTYSPEELKKMTAGEVTRAVSADIFENACRRQRREGRRYRGHRLAEGIETAFFICPRCGGVDTLKSAGDNISCGCGFKARFTEKGCLEGEGLPFSWPDEWEDWQCPALEAQLQAAPEGKNIFSDTALELFELDGRGGERPLGKGELSLSRSKIAICGRDFPFSAISAMEVRGRDKLVFTGGGYFEIRGKRLWCARKYLMAWEMLK